MTSNDQVRQALNVWIAGVTGKVSILAYQGGPRPALPYISVNMTGTAEVRTHSQEIEYTPSRADEPDPVEDTAGDPIYPPITAAPVIEIEWRFSVHAYGGEDPTDHLRPIVSAVQIKQVVESLFPFSVYEVSQVRNVPEWIDSAWEPRGQIDIFLRGLTRDGFVIATIDDIEPYNVTRQGI